MRAYACMCVFFIVCVCAVQLVDAAAELLRYAVYYKHNAEKLEQIFPVCISVCEYMYMYMCMYMCAFVYKCICVCICNVHVYVPVLCAFMNVCVCFCVQASFHSQLKTLICRTVAGQAESLAPIEGSKLILIHTRAHTHTYTHTHTHTYIYIFHDCT